MVWYRSIGGKSSERVFGLEFFDNKIFAAGYISDTIYWGGVQLTTTSTSNRDMFTGSFTKEGEPRDANTFYGQGTDESRNLSPRETCD